MFGEKLRRQSVNLHCCAMTSIQKSALRSQPCFGGQTLTVHRKAVEGGWLFAVEHPDGKQAALAQLLVQPE